MAPRTQRDLLFGPLAQSLAQEEWSLRDLQNHLEQRLPETLRATARTVAKDLKLAFPTGAAPDAALLLRHLKNSAGTVPLFRHFKRTGMTPDMPTDPPRFRPVPALANLTAFALDTRLAGLARSIGANYTRYADDLTFSGDAPIADILQRAVPDIVRESGFALNAAKTRVQPTHRRQVVTGLVVNRHLNLSRPDYDHLKAVIHHLRNPSDPRRSDRAFIDRLAGRIAWLEQVNPARGAKLRERLAAALQTGSIR